MSRAGFPSQRPYTQTSTQNASGPGLFLYRAPAQRVHDIASGPGPKTFETQILDSRAPWVFPMGPTEGVRGREGGREGGGQGEREGGREGGREGEKICT